MDLNVAGTVWAPIISALFAGASAVVAWIAIARPQKLVESKALVDQAILSLERAYDVLTDGGTNISPPPASRVNWLTAARHIVTYQSLRGMVTNETHRIIMDDHAEWWRHKFYVALKMHRMNDVGYYKNEAAGPGEQLAKESLIIVYDFTSWPDDREDPLSDLVVQRAAVRKKFLNGNSALEMYLDLKD